MNTAELGDEAELVHRAQTDPQAFGPLYDRYIDRIYAFVYRHTGEQDAAQDITAATFEKALRYLPRYEPRGLSFGAWLYRIARNETVQYYRKARWLRPFGAVSVETASTENTSALIEQSETHALLANALARLRIDDRTLLLLKFYEQLPHQEIAQIMGWSLPNLYVRLHRALQRLRVQYEALSTEPHEKETQHVQA